MARHELVLACLLLTSCARSPRAESKPNFTAKPFAEWPQIVLTNDAEFRGHSALKGASSFLVRNQRGVIVAVTARHLLGDAGGVEPAVAVDELAAALISWRVHPRTMPAKAIELGGVAIPKLAEANRDWLVLALKSTPAKLPAEPLRLRRDPVRVGDAVYLIGCAYAEPHCLQSVYRGKVTSRFRGDYWRFDLDPPVQLPGFSGAPIDGDGAVVGVMTVWFEPRMSGERWLEAGGEDVGPVFDAVEALK